MVAGGISVTVTGLDKALANLGTMPTRASDAMESGLYRWSLEVFAESQRQVPVDTGALRASGHVEPPTRTKDEVEIHIGYGGPSVDYAYIVHERLDVYHAPPTKAKYLEDPINQHQPELDRILGNDMSVAMGTGMP